METSQPSLLPAQVLPPTSSLPKPSTPPHINHHRKHSLKPTNKRLIGIMQSEVVGENRSPKRQRLSSDDGFDEDAFFQEGLFDHGFESEVWHLCLTFHTYKWMGNWNYY
jgi:hypothetical protein